jgi:hypothetical protein
LEGARRSSQKCLGLAIFWIKVEDGLRVLANERPLSPTRRFIGLIEEAIDAALDSVAFHHRLQGGRVARSR